jgi:histidine triad (HIT) family protein
MNEECIFCKIVKGEIPSTKTYESDNFIGILDINPVSENHTLIVPKQHYKTILDLPENLGSELITSIKKVSSKLIEEKKAEGFNIIQSNFEVAQQEVPHLYFHLLPRKKSDGFKIIG